MSDYWKDNGITKPQQRVVCAACKKGLHIVLGARHFDDRMREQMKRTDEDWAGAHQGFINQFGEFLTREQAFTIAMNAGQEIDIERNRSDHVLYSEGLY